MSTEGPKAGGRRALAAGLTGLPPYLKNPARVPQWASTISGQLEKISKRPARHSAAADIQGKIAAFAKFAHVEGLLPYGPGIKRIVKGDGEPYAEGSEAVVAVERRRNRDRNFVVAARHSTSKALVPTIRHDPPRELINAAELAVQGNAIRSQRAQIEQAQGASAFPQAAPALPVLGRARASAKVAAADKGPHVGVFRLRQGAAAPAGAACRRRRCLCGLPAAGG